MVALLLLGLLLLGLPGALVFALATRLIVGRDGFGELPPDAAWPIAIGVSLAVPLIIPPATWLVVRSRPSWSGARVALAVVGLTLAWGAVVSLALYALYLP